MKPPVVYDKAKYHLESVQQSGLDNVQSQVHTAFFLGWLIDNSLLSSEMENDSADLLAQYRSGEKTALDVYGWWDGCLIDDMLSDEGNEFAAEYFDFSRGEYIHDYIALFARLLETRMFAAAR